MIHATDATFARDVLQSDTLVLVDFWAEWCGPCRLLAPVLDAVQAANQEKVKVVKVNVEDNPVQSTQYQVKSLPTLILFKGGKEVERRHGHMSQAKIQEWLASHM